MGENQREVCLAAVVHGRQIEEDLQPMASSIRTAVHKRASQGAGDTVMKRLHPCKYGSCL
jgi:hypothetical protein